MSDLLARARVVLRAAPTWLTAAAVVLTAAAHEISTVAPSGGEDIVRWLVTAAAWLTSAVAIIRRVSPVPPAERGLLAAAEPDLGFTGPGGEH